MSTIKKILITLGDVGGIGPEVVIKALQSFNAEEIALVGNREIFYKTAVEFNLSIPENLEIIDIPFDISKLKMGEPTTENGKHAMLSLLKCCELAKENIARAIVTAPVSKKAINMAGYNYSGQTEILKKYLQENNIKRVLSGFSEAGRIPKPEMLFVAGGLRVVLMTRHIKLGEVAQSLKTENILNSIINLKYSLENDFNIKNPKIAMCALNPHAGEDGLLGMEEEYFFAPAIKQLREKHSVDVEGPFPSDNLWAKAANAFMYREKLPYDAYAACYHDQGLIPVKMLAMNSAVNVTINLPVIRTSPCHGTAYDISGQNVANPQSMYEAIKLAQNISAAKVY